MAEWLSVHVHYRGDLDVLLRDAVAPLVRDNGFFLRYWDGGSHVRVRLRHADRSIVAERLHGYLAASPAPETTSPQEYARLAPVLAAREGMTGHLPLRPNNSIEFVPYQPELGKYGGNLAAVERHFTESSRLALDVLHRRPSGNQRAVAVLGVLLLAWDAADGSPDAVEELCRGWRGGQDLPDSLVEAEFAPMRDRLAALAGSVRSLPPRPGDPGSSLAAWAATFGELSARLPAADRLRVLDNCAHLTANRLGVPMAEEVRLRLLASQALRETLPAGRR
ncbi:lantibiotic dehydratase C-terminal domain-containing protein [Lentzea sp. NEAU-D7]|uniref:lantibiotic dehydratase C-terminal domain-containing protein n=1 Tax=Lentzea sp. NEAU-D7 TaxID=2994667 RepID=UPI00224AC4F3|nr:lantibiotic dehydratase C-terminal domain-containing protein [Lentzea sp. NEAU-D7]MCX2951557.1 hypothetical protein [Lentzea sp. NEAU-D7]